MTLPIFENSDAVMKNLRFRPFRLASISSACFGCTPSSSVTSVTILAVKFAS